MSGLFRRGKGTTAGGWIDDAVSFWEAQMEKEDTP